MNLEYEAGIRAAFASGEFSRAPEAVDRMGRAHGSGYPPPVGFRETLARMRGLIDWARLVNLSFRARASGRLAALHAAALYSGPPARPAAWFRASL